MLDRTQAPPAVIPRDLVIPAVNIHPLSSGIPVYFMHNEQEKVIKLELMYEIDLHLVKNAVAASFAAKLFKEGSKHYSASEIHEKLEQLGSFVEAGASRESFSITAYVMTEKLPAVLDILMDLILNPLFEDADIERVRQQEISQYKINEKKSSFLAGRSFQRAFFGKDSFYGRYVEMDDLQGVTKEDIKEFYFQVLMNAQQKIFLSGWVDDVSLNSVIQSFSSLRGKTTEKVSFAADQVGRGKYVEEVKDSVQTSLRLGKSMPNRFHPDTHKIMYANEVFGGYFGSRLMKKIREEKGYTYGIYSRVRHLSNASHLLISAEVIQESKEQAWEETVAELKKLHEELVPDSEMELVRNYHVGSLLNGISSAFAVMEFHKMIYRYSLPKDYYNRRIEDIRNTNAEELRQIYHSYFQPEELLSVLVG